MSPRLLFQIQLVLGYVAWFLCIRAYVLPRLRNMEPVAAHRAIATFHSFRFFGLVFILPGVVAPNLPGHFAAFAASWDLATGVLAMLALLTVRIRPLFWLFVVSFNLVGMVDLILDYYHAIQAGLPAVAGRLGAAYFIPVIYVPALMITHIVAFSLLRKAGRREDGKQLAGHAQRSAHSSQLTAHSSQLIAHSSPQLSTQCPNLSTATPSTLP